MSPPRVRILLMLPILACALALAIPATGAGAASAKVRACGRGAVKEYPYFDVRAHGATCPVAQHLIRSFLCTSGNGHCYPGNHWHIAGGILIGHWITPKGWHCSARIPPALYENGEPFGAELCRRGSAWVSSKSYG
jgi:hypothetical protein